LEEIDLVYTWSTVWIHQFYTIHTQIILLLRNRPPIPPIMRNRNPNAIPCFPHNRPKYLAMASNANLQYNNPIYHTMYNKTYAN
jgi:hypothetical protein